MTLAFISGPFRAPSPWLVELNIRAAEAVALKYWRLGFAVICPHTNTRFFTGAADDSVWLAGDLEMLSRCDVIVMLPSWIASAGARCEFEMARDRNMPIFYE